MRALNSCCSNAAVAWVFLIGVLFSIRGSGHEIKGVSVASSSAPLAWTSSGSSGAAVFSAGGRHAFFLGTAGNLTTNVPTGFVDVFRRDLVSGTTVLASSRNENGGRGNGSVSAFSVSANGRWVAFSSRASDLVLGDTNQVEDVFLRDMDAGNTLRISQSSDGGPANEESGVPMLSTDGRFLLFESAASNLVAGTDTNRQTDVFLWDRETGVTARISNATNGVAANGPSSAILLSEDGSRVLFRSVATDLVATGDSIPSDLFVWSRSSGAITRIELPGPLPGAWQLPLAAFNPVLSSNGRFLAFRTGVALSSVAEYEGVWWFDLEQGTRTRVSGGLFVRWPIGHSDSSGPVMSKDGQRVAFEAQTDSTSC
jgi:Tol biopolymer transport system component